jgi:toxin-antitoxin system PIN domain toxin
MILPDVNLLLFAYNPHAAQHAQARQWWEQALNGTELIGLPHEVLFGFIRIATNPRLGAASIPLSAAHRVVTTWIEQPHCRILSPGADHFSKVMELMQQSNSAGPVLSDAILAAHALAHRATLCSNDSDFARFKGLSWKNPLHPI